MWHLLCILTCLHMSLHVQNWWKMLKNIKKYFFIMCARGSERWTMKNGLKYPECLSSAVPQIYIIFYELVSLASFPRILYFVPKYWVCTHILLLYRASQQRDIRINCDNKINQVFFIFNTTELWLARKDLRASTSVGLNRENPILDPLAVLHLDNRL